MRLAAIAPLYGRHHNTFPLLHRLLVATTRVPDELWLMCETTDDYRAVDKALDELYEMELLERRRPEEVQVCACPTPRMGGSYEQIPYSRKINIALDLCEADAVVYVDNGSIPAEEKFSEMLSALETNPEWGAVYCTQRRTGYREETHYADAIVEQGYGVVNFTQVMHRFPVQARWTLDMAYANPDLADAIFWRDLHKELGPFHPAGGLTVLDVHDMPSPAAAGI